MTTDADTIDLPGHDWEMSRSGNGATCRGCQLRAVRWSVPHGSGWRYGRRGVLDGGWMSAEVFPRLSCAEIARLPTGGPIVAPTALQCERWLRRTQEVLDLCRTHDVYAGGSNQVPERLRRELVHGRTIEGGCAARLLHAAVSLRDGGHDWQGAYDLAREIIQHEQGPSPGWTTLLAESGFPEDPTGTAND